MSIINGTNTNLEVNSNTKLEIAKGQVVNKSVPIERKFFIGVLRLSTFSNSVIMTVLRTDLNTTGESIQFQIIGAVTWLQITFTNDFLVTHKALGLASAAMTNKGITTLSYMFRNGDNDDIIFRFNGISEDTDIYVCWEFINIV
jgi:hypothetical protein